MNEEQAKLAKVYKRASVGLAIAAVLWAVAYAVGNRAGWEEHSIFIPIASGVLSALFYSLYLRTSTR